MYTLIVLVGFMLSLPVLKLLSQDIVFSYHYCDILAIFFDLLLLLVFSTTREKHQI